jgi:hypothetical protein
MTLWLVKAQPRNVTGAALPRDEGSDGRPAGLATRTMEGVGEGTYNLALATGTTTAEGVRTGEMLCWYRSVASPSPIRVRTADVLDEPT